MNTALDIGIKEQDFWCMTFGEVFRAIESYNRTEKLRKQEQACFDYILADLIGRSIARTQHSANQMPEIAVAYPGVFDAEQIQEQKEQKQNELSALRFRQFANSYNKRFSEVSDNK